MTVAMGSPVALGLRTWRLSWSSSLPAPVTYYVWRDGRQICETTETSMVFSAPAGESLVIEVLDDEDELPETYWPTRALLEWQAGVAVDHYRIEEYVGGQWILRTTVRDRGEGRFHWDTRVLEDSASHQFRVVPVGTNGNQGAARTFVLLMVRIPDVPDVDYTYSESTGAVTISAA